MILMIDRKRQVILTAQRLFVEKGFATTSVQDILDEANISKGTFYNYFSTKNECLIAIVNNGKDEVDVRRQELLAGQAPSDKQVFVEQVSIRQRVSQDRNLLPIFEALFHSGDPELREFALKNHLAELSWMTGRLVDIYGEKARPYALDCAVLMFGMMQHTTHIKAMNAADEIDVEKLVAFALRRVDTMMENMIATSDRLFQQDVLLAIEKENNKDFITQAQLIEQLQNLQHGNKHTLQPGEKQYITFMLEELATQYPRPYLLESVALSLCKTGAGTDHEFETRELALNIGRYIEETKKGV